MAYACNMGLFSTLSVECVALISIKTSENLKSISGYSIIELNRAFKNVFNIFEVCALQLSK